MWVDYIENSKALETVFKGRFPELEQISIFDVKLQFCIELQLQLGVKINQLPIEKPKKWNSKGVNNVCLIICFIDVHIEKFNDISSSYANVSIAIERNTDGLNRVNFIDKDNNVLMAFTARWIELLKMIGVSE